MGDTRVPGLYERIIDEALAARLGDTPAERRALSRGEAPRRLAGHLADYLQRALSGLEPQAQVAAVNAVLDALAGQLEGFVQPEDRLRPELLTAITDGRPPPTRPDVPLSEAALFMNARGERRLGVELRKELASADGVDLIVAFLLWSGYLTLRDHLAGVVARGGTVRVISTPYRGVTEARVLDDLQQMGAQVRIAYDTQSTRLHAKAWILKRHSGFSTAFVGSSNLSKSALHSGLEWNVRLSAVENRAVLAELQGMFDHYWGDPDFQPYERAQFLVARKAERGSDALHTVFALRPRPFQRDILERLDAERTVHDHHRNLVVAATGTGKTVVAALDYARQALDDGRRPRLLFVVHRKEILRQARDTFRHAVGDGSFGELLVDGEEPVDWQHVFASIQSLRTRMDRFDPKHFQHVIVDEFHHAEARSYQALLDHVAPAELVGLTATPERSDGLDVLRHFGGRVAAEIRLWDAIDRGFLVPFSYFVVHDGVDLSRVTWRRGSYDQAELNRLYTGHTARAHLITHAVQRHVADAQAMRAIGFCVGVDHARFMAQAFNAGGVKAAVLLGDTPKAERADLLAALQSEAPDRPRILFAVDVLNEGVDLPAVDTVLLLRPTESATVFLQQLGRGLRRAPGKRGLTVLDFVGTPNRRFRFDLKLRALTGASRRQLREHVQQDFPWLPAGCEVQFDRQSRELVLENLRQGIGVDKRSLVAELKRLGDVPLGDLLADAGLELADVYRKRSLTDLRRAAGFAVSPAGPDEDALGRALGRLIHVDDPERLDIWLRLVDRLLPPPPAADERANRHRLMLSTALFGAEAVGPDALAPLWAHPALRAELVELLAYLRATQPLVTVPLPGPAPLHVHAQYTRNEIMAAFGDLRGGQLYEPREGVVYLSDPKVNLLFVTIQKDPDDYSPSTLYRDHALSPDRFHWESQS
ncbi:MAG: DUF3427 domain-containing protein, partial [Myxococcales bacterium]|nr:DUF3427 domain-containing protein [Myxococcales bacterium]